MLIRPLGGSPQLSVHEAIQKNGPMLMTAAIVSAVSFVVWGQIGLLSTAASIFMFYTFFGPVIKVLNYFDLRGVILATAAFVLPHLGGIAAILGSAYLGVCVLGYEWQQARIRIDLEDQTERLRQTNRTLQEQLEQLEKSISELGQLVETAEKTNEDLSQSVANTELTMQAQRRADQARRESADILASLKLFVQDPNNQEQLKLFNNLQEQIQASQLKLGELNSKLKEITEQLNNSTQIMGQSAEALQGDIRGRQQLTATLLSELPEGWEGTE